MCYPPWKLFAQRHLHPRKALGQNFLVDPSTAEMIVRKSGVNIQSPVVEIGAGLGALTLPLSRAAKLVYAIEKDGALAAALEDELNAQDIRNVGIKNQDIFEVDLGAIADKEKKKLMIFGNLPYYISSQVLIYLIGARQAVQQADLMFQKEVARRLIAGPGGKLYGRLSVLLQYYTEIRRTATVSAHLFWPVPKVDSEVLQFRFKTSLSPVVCNHELFVKVVKAAFGQRRKTLRNAMQTAELRINRDELIDIFGESGINAQSRAESLTVDQFVQLTNTIDGHQRKKAQ